MRLLAGLFDAWHDRRAEPAPRPRLRAPVRASTEGAFRALLERGQRCGHYKAVGLCDGLLKLWPALWTFVTVAGVEPTNNARRASPAPGGALAQGQLRHPERRRATSSSSALLSVAATCKQQDRSLLAYLTAVCTAAQQGQPIPSLLPAPPSRYPPLRRSGGVNDYDAKSARLLGVG